MKIEMLDYHITPITRISLSSSVNACTSLVSFVSATFLDFFVNDYGLLNKGRHSIGDEFCKKLDYWVYTFSFHLSLQWKLTHIYWLNHTIVLMHKLRHLWGFFTCINKIYTCINLPNITWWLFPLLALFYIFPTL